ncbi:zinc ribbon domain-containing protein [Ancylobacter mangrovi]|uniref:zinc ribbon domain-containing protein n=1 Tax=Ancylobacter mangrovi TaxID=2972472 RepID=UPI002163CAFE|nr:zinc ribbon domain-containing protein [Ancylobacter mangrovi]MCS0502199.1 zinc ribbon domain-containing protein [Ancylobacter mangrovi]
MRVIEGRCKDCQSELAIAVRFCPFCGVEQHVVPPEVPEDVAQAYESTPADELPAVDPLDVPISQVEEAARTEAPAIAVDRPGNSGQTLGTVTGVRGWSRPQWGAAAAAVLTIAAASIFWLYHGNSGGGSRSAAGSSPERGAGKEATSSADRQTRTASGPVPAPMPRPAAAPSQRTVSPSPPAASTVADRSRAVLATAEWVPVNLAPDSERPFVSLQALEPFRLRVDGRLYLVAGGRPLGIDFSRVRNFEVKSLHGATQVTVTRYAARP